LNYLAHAYHHLDNPYFAAGTGLPDWMSVVDRKNRPRRQFAEPVAEHSDPSIAAFARGCLQHHADDFWFHQNERFVTLSTQFAVELRELLEPGLGHQAGFVGHIVVELLLDAILIERDPSLLDSYYAALESLDVELVQAGANAICRQPVTRLVELVPKFIEVRFLADYSDDVLLLRNLNRVMKRVGLPLLPDSVAGWCSLARQRVRASADELLTSPASI
jgi:hypothetical protein